MPLIDMLKWHKSEKVKTTTSFKVWLYFCLGSLTVIYFYFDQQVHHTLLTLSFPVISQGDYDVASLIKSAKPELLAVIGFNFITGLVWFGLSKKVVLK
jgi:hypothetical protein